MLLFVFFTFKISFVKKKKTVLLTSISILLVKTPYLNTFQAVVLLRTITPNGNRATKQNPDSSFALFLSEVSFANTENLHGCKRSEGNILFLSNITTHSQTFR